MIGKKKEKKRKEKKKIKLRFVKKTARMPPSMHKNHIPFYLRAMKWKGFVVTNVEGKKIILSPQSSSD